jgi:uncharacterized protein YdhG (YjbR/CyaY superfamily)
MAKTKFKSVNEYIASKPKDVRDILQAVRGAIRKAVPAAEEGIAYQIPVYKLNSGPLLYFAGWKEHYSLYPAGNDLVAEFKDELSGYELSKGTIRFPLSEPVPLKLIARIAKFRAKQLNKREKGKGGRKTGREAQLERVRRICDGMPSVSEKLSHGAPTFFVEKDKGVFTMFVDNHHEDGHLAVWLPAPPGLQSHLIEDAPETYFKPPYVGSGGWIGIELEQIRDEALEIHVRQAWELAAAPKKKKPRQRF